ncbi:hypothetical protein ACFQ9X_28445 [Catenulispora yoronensis]
MISPSGSTGVPEVCSWYLASFSRSSCTPRLCEYRCASGPSSSSVGIGMSNRASPSESVMTSAPAAFSS